MAVLVAKIKYFNWENQPGVLYVVSIDLVGTSMVVSFIVSSSILKIVGNKLRKLLKFKKVGVVEEILLFIDFFIIVI